MADLITADTTSFENLALYNNEHDADAVKVVVQTSEGRLNFENKSAFEQTVNKQQNLNYDGTGGKYPSVDAVNDWTRNMAKVATKTGLLHKLDNFNLVVVDIATARITAIDSVIFWDELFVPATSPSAAIKSFAQKDYPLTQLITATGGNVNIDPLTTDGLYIRYLGYDKNGNVYSAINSFQSNNSVFNIGFVTVIKTGSAVEFLGGVTAGARNVFPQPNLASNTDYDKIAGITTNVVVGGNSAASFHTESGTLTGISINWKSLQNPVNGNPIDVFNYTGSGTGVAVAFASINATFASQTTAITPHTLWTETEGGIAINNSFFNTTSGLRDTMNNGTASIKRVLLGVRGGVFLQDGEHTTNACYANLATAKDNIFTHDFTNAIIPPGVVIEIARIAYVKGCTNLNDNTQAFIVNVNAGSGGGSAPVPPVSDATTVTKGIIKLAGDFDATSTADIPVIVSSSETLAGKVELATNAETLTGTDNTRAVHPQGLQAKIAALSFPTVVLTTNTNITSSDLVTQDVAGFVSYINNLLSSFAVAANEIRTYTVTNTGQVFELLLRGRSFGGSEPDIVSADVLEVSPVSLGQISITTSISITTDTKNGDVIDQFGKHVLIYNGVNNINITVNGVGTKPTTYQKEGTGTITFIAGSGRTLRTVDGTAILSGSVGSTASIASDGTTDSLRISNA